jgi:hypothetical protein
MKCYRKYNKKMAELLSHVRPLAFNGKHLKLTTNLTSSSSLSKIELKIESNSVHKKIKDKKYSHNNNIPNELTTNDKTLQNGGTIRAQKWKATTVRRQFGYRIVVSKCIYDNNKTAPGRY